MNLLTTTGQESSSYTPGLSHRRDFPHW